MTKATSDRINLVNAVYTNKSAEFLMEMTMVEDTRTNVMGALEIVPKEIAVEIENVNRDSARLFNGGEYEKATDVLKRAEKLKRLRDRIEAIESDWKTLFPGEKMTINSRPLPPGVRTPEDQYYLPNLEALRELGGSARKSEVLERVLQRMKHVLRTVDFVPVDSTPNVPRWQNTAALARNTLKERGLMRKDSPHGVWEISDSGIQTLKRRNSG